MTTPNQSAESEDSAGAEADSCLERFVFDATKPESAREARHAVASTLEKRGFGDIVDDIVTCLSEGFTNAHLYAGGSVAVVVRTSGTRVTIEIEDGADGEPTLHVPAEADSDGVPQLSAIADGGRGIFLIAHLTNAWGVRTRAVGKTLWFTRDTSQSVTSS